jgi:hypothetical protein
MKALIWIGCCAGASIINIILADVGVRLGAIPYTLLYAGAIWLATKLCKKLDWHRIEKKAAEAGMTVSEYGKQGLSEKFLSKLEELCNTVPYEQVKPQLKACVRSGKITKEQCIILLEEYCKKK